MPIYNLLGTETKRSRICPNACLLINYWLYCSSLSPACWVALACSFVAQWQSTRPREQSVVGLSPTLYDSSYFLEEVFSFVCDMRVSGPVNHTQLTEVKVGAPLFGSSNESCFVLYTCWEYLCSLSVMWTILRLAFSRSSCDGKEFIMTQYLLTKSRFILYVWIILVYVVSRLWVKEDRKCQWNA